MRMRKDIEIDRTPEELWPWLSEPELLKRWMKGLLEITPQTEGPPRVGFRSTMKIKEGRKVSVYEEELVVYEPPHKVRSRMTGGAFPEGMEMIVGWDVEDLGGGRSRVTGVSDCDVKGCLMTVMSPLFKLFASMQVKGFLKKLKLLAESGPPPAGAGAETAGAAGADDAS